MCRSLSGTCINQFANCTKLPQWAMFLNILYALYYLISDPFSLHHLTFVILMPLSSFYFFSSATTRLSTRPLQTMFVMSIRETSDNENLNSFDKVVNPTIQCSSKPFFLSMLFYPIKTGIEISSKAGAQTVHYHTSE